MLYILINYIVILFSLFYCINSCERKKFSIEIIDGSTIILKAFVGRKQDEKNYTTTNNNIFLSLLPEIVYKGGENVRRLESFNSAEYFNYKGQLNATTLNLSGCYDNNILQSLPTELIVFGILNNNNQIIIQQHGILLWSKILENKLWRKLGWSDWSEFTSCSVTCGNGVQQRYRHCLKTEVNVNSKILKQRNNEYCEGYNIEQRNCNMFECTGIIDLLNFTTKDLPKNSYSKNRQIILKEESFNFTLMMTFTSKKLHQGKIFSLRSKTNTSKSISLEISKRGFKIFIEKKNYAENFEISGGDIHDGKIHYFTISVRNGDLIMNYVDCSLESTYIVSKGFISLSEDMDLHIEQNLNCEIHQLIINTDDNTALQCSSKIIPIQDKAYKLLKLK